MLEKELYEHILRAVQDVDLREEDIPAIDLYLDQILSLVAEKNAESAPRYRDRALTKTMVNNYSKDGLISPLKGKKYSRAHIAEMLLIYAMKNTLSIEEIKRVLTGVRDGCGFTGEDMVGAYRRFLDLKEKNRNRVGEIAGAVVKEDGLDVHNDRDFFLALLDVLSLSVYLKEIGREMLEYRYADLAALKLEREERERAEERARNQAKKAEKRERKAQKVMQKADRKIAKLDIVGAEVLEPGWEGENQ